MESGVEREVTSGEADSKMLGRFRTCEVRK